jgi:hypothetical protein
MVKFSSFLALALVPLAVLSTQSKATSYDSLYHPQYHNEAAGYARVIQLQHAGSASGKLLATWEHWYLPEDYLKTRATYSNGTASNFIIRESSDRGTTWDTIATVGAPDGVPNLYFYQPFLFEFPQALGNYPAGTLLLVGNLFDGHNTSFFSWRSTDQGKKWDPIGIWQTSQTPAPNTKLRSGIWEPFLFLDSQSRLVAVFSDERQYLNHSQMLVHVISEDGGVTWSKNVTQDVASSQGSARPGMATVARMDNGEFFMTYEWCDNRTYGTNHSRPCSVHGKSSKDGFTWNPTDNGTFVSTPDSVQASGSPYVIWDPVGKQLIVSSRAQRRFSPTAEIDDVFAPATVLSQHVIHVNKNYGDGHWSWTPAPWFVPNSKHCGSNYSPNLLALSYGTMLYSTNNQAPGAQCEEDTGAAPTVHLPYTSNFSAIGDAGWIEFDDHWSTSGDRYAFAPVTTPSTIVLTGSSGWTDYEISADVTISSTSGVAGVLVRASNSFTAPNSLTRYTAVIDSNRGDLALFRVGDQATSTLHTEPVSGGVKTNQSHHLSLSVHSTTLVVKLTDGNGTSTSLNVNDGGLLRGAAGLYGSYGSGYFSNVHIKSLA